MDLTWNPFALTGLIAATLSFITAAVVYSARPRARQNRWLALSMVAEGIFVGAGWGLDPLATTPSAAFASAMVTLVGWVFFPVLYLFFISTLNAPLARPLRSRVGQGALAALLVVAAGIAVLGRHQLVSGVVYAPEPHGWRWNWDFEPAFYTLMALQAAVMLFGLAVAVSLFRATPRASPRRPAAVAYLAAFAFRDSVTLLAMLLLIVGHPSLSLIEDILPPTSTIGFTLLIGYGVLRTQLFDIDLHIKWGLQRGTLVGIFVAVFFMVTVSAENFLTDRYGWAYGGVVAGLLLFALNPLHRLADRVADTAMPRVRDDEEYRTVRKREVYRAALEGAIEDGVITERERAMLARLADSLGIKAYEALALERDLMQLLGGTDPRGEDAVAGPVPGEPVPR